MAKKLFSSISLLLLFTILFGFFYPTLIFFCGKVFFPKKASGSLVYLKGDLIGSKLIGQNFSKDSYFHPRPSFA